MISASERQERLEAMEDVVGTNRAEGIVFDEATPRLMRLYVEGELSLPQMSAAMRARANSLGASQESLVNAA